MTHSLDQFRRHTESESDNGKANHNLLLLFFTLPEDKEKREIDRKSEQDKA